MSNLHPGGQRTAPFSRIFGFENIKRAIQQNSTNHRKKARGSIAQANRHGGLHEHRREIARHRRQAGLA